MQIRISDELNKITLECKADQTVEILSNKLEDIVKFQLFDQPCSLKLFHPFQGGTVTLGDVILYQTGHASILTASKYRTVI